MTVRTELHSTTRDIDGVITGAYFMVVVSGTAYYQNCPDGRWVKLAHIPKKSEFKMALPGSAVGYHFADILNALVEVERERLLRKVIPAGGLRAVRKWCRISQLELGKVSGYAQTTIAAWENGGRAPTLAGTRAITDAMNQICKGRNLPGTFTLDDLFPR